MLERFGGVQSTPLQLQRGRQPRGRLADGRPYQGMTVCESIPLPDARVCAGHSAQREIYREIDEIAVSPGQAESGFRGKGWNPFRPGNPARHVPASIPIDFQACSRNTDFDRRLVPPPGCHSQPAVVRQRKPAGSMERGSVYIKPNGGTMSADLQFLEEWIPEKMDPGYDFFVLEISQDGSRPEPFVAVMSCPRCGTLG